KTFYLFPHPDPGPRIVCVGFDGKERWACEGRAPVTYTQDGNRLVAPFDVDEAGTLYVLEGDSAKKIDPDGKPDGEVKLKVGEAVRVGGLSGIAGDGRLDPGARRLLGPLPRQGECRGAALAARRDLRPPGARRRRDPPAGHQGVGDRADARQPQPLRARRGD